MALPLQRWLLLGYSCNVIKLKYPFFSPKLESCVSLDIKGRCMKQDTLCHHTSIFRLPFSYSHHLSSLAVNPVNVSICLVSSNGV